MGDWRCQEAIAVFTSVWKRVTAMVEPAACGGGGDAVHGGRAIAFALDPGQANELPPARCLPGVDLRQPPPRREPLGTAEGMVRPCDTLGKDRALLPRRPLPRRYCRLAQVIKL